MTKAEFIEAFSEKTSFTKKDSEIAVNAFTECVKEALADEGKLTLVNFGSFEKRKRAAHKVTNPRTKKPMKVPAKNVVTFKAGKGLKEYIQ